MFTCAVYVSKQHNLRFPMHEVRPNTNIFLCEGTRWSLYVTDGEPWERNFETLLAMVKICGRLER